MKRAVLYLGISVAFFTLAGCAAAQPGSGGDITGKVWALSELTGNSLLPGTGITAQFTTDGNISGSAGCNRYQGTYTVSGSAMTIEQPLATTMMACVPAVMDQENAYLKVLGQAETFSVNGDRLTLSDTNNRVLLVYQVQTQDLAGTAWEAVSYNNGKQAVTSVLAGTSLTANFGQDGQLSGSAGCNNYNGPYKVDEARITIGPLASTRKACSEPSGVMDQEMQYLAALQSAVSYQVEGSVLELRTEEGALAASFNKK